MTFSACLWLGLFPLLQGGTYARLTHDKWVIMLILTGVTLLCFLTDHLSRRRKGAVSAGAGYGRPEKNVPALFLLRFLPCLLVSALLLWTVLSCLAGSSGPETWWLGEGARYEGLAACLCYFALFFCFFFSRVNLKAVLLSAAFGAAVFFLIVLLQRSGGNPLGLYPGSKSYATNYEFQGTTGNIDMGTGYLLLLAGLFLHGLIRSVPEYRSRPESSAARPPLFRRGVPVLPVILSVSFLIVLWLILTMGVQFGIVSLAFLLLFTLFRFLPRRFRLPLLILLVVLALLVVWFWPGQAGGLWELREILHGRARPSFGSNRIAVWDYSLRLARENLLFGGGPGSFPSRFNRYLRNSGLAIPEEQDGVPLPHYFDNPHNEYIALLTDRGLPALLLYAALLMFALYRRREAGYPRPVPCTAAVLCYAVQAFFSFSICIVAPMFWVLLALSFRE